MDVMKNIKKFLISNNYKFDKKRKYYTRLEPNIKPNEILKDLKIICKKDKLIILQSENSKNILIYSFNLHTKLEYLFIRLFDYNYKFRNNSNSCNLRYFIDYQKFGLFAILGPEGVGKSTLCNNISKFLLNAPFKYDTFHHTGEWKAKVRKQDAKVNKTKARFLISVIPPFLKKLINMIRGEFKYFDNLSKILYSKYLQKKIIICDRYCYDRYVRWINLRKPALQKLTLYFLCHLMKKPTKCFLLVDTPIRIFKRKKVMPLWEIPKHIKLLEEICKKFNVKFIKINVKNFNEIKLRNYVIQKIIFEKRNQIIDEYLF